MGFNTEIGYVLKMLKWLVGMKFSGQQGNQLVEMCGIPQLETRLRN